MVSFDIVSLFNNVTAEGACTIAKERPSEEGTLRGRTDLTADHIDDLLKFCVSLSSFRWRKEFFEQSMGSPISAVLADMFTEEIEQTAIVTADCHPQSKQAVPRTP